MKKQSITLEMIFNEMGSMYSDLMNKMEDLKHELREFTQITGNNSENSTQNSTNDIPNTEYVTITADDVLVGGEPTRQYHGQDLYNYYLATNSTSAIQDVPNYSNVENGMGIMSARVTKTLFLTIRDNTRVKITERFPEYGFYVN